MLFGVDVHTTYQAGLNVEQLAAEGYAFCVVKATQGAGGFTAPPAFDDWIARTRKAGMVAGAYHWLDFSDPVRQADRFLARLAPVGGHEGLLLQIDCEDDATPAILSAFVAQMNRRTGGHPLLLYSGSWWWPTHMGSFDAASLGLHLWHSSYVNGIGAASQLARLVGEAMWQPGYGGWPVATILQFTDKGSAGGLLADVDLNAFRGSRADLLELTGGTPSQGDDMSWNEASAILGGTTVNGFADNPHDPDVPDWVRQNIRYNLANLHTKVDAMGDTVAKLAAQVATGPAGTVDPVALAAALAGNRTFVDNVADALAGALGRRLING